MTSGIYKLTFKNGDEYIGKSNNIERRWEEHTSNLYSNKASEKMMKTFHKYGMPEFNILMRAHKDHIDILEAYYISCERPALNSVVAKCIHSEDFDMLREHPELLEVSTIDHISTIIDSKEAMKECADLIAIQRDEIEDLRKIRNKEEIETECSSKLQEEIDSLYAEAELNDKTIANLYDQIEYLKLPWWKKLFM